MATYTIPEPDTFAAALQKTLEDEIRNSTEKIRKEAVAEVHAEIDRWIAAMVIKIFHVCSYERMGNELRITVDTSKMKKSEGA